MPPAVRCVAPEPHRRQGAAAGCARQCPYGGGVRWLVQASFGWSPLPFMRRTTSAVSATAARCRGRVRTPMPQRGACGPPVQAKYWLVLHGHLYGAQQARSAPRRQGAAAGCARQCPYGGRAGCRYRQALVCRQSHLRGAQIRPHRRLRGAQQARLAPRRQGAAAGCARQYPYGGRAGCRYRQALVGLQGHFRGAQQARLAPRTNVRELLAFGK